MYFDYSSLCLCSSKETKNYCDLWKEIERGYHACLIYQLHKIFKILIHISFSL